MTGDEQLPEPGPVAEYRDPELVRRFRRESVPLHGPEFWTELEARLVGEPVVVSTDRPAVLEESGVADAEADVAELLSPVQLGRATDRVGQRVGGWTRGRWLGVAAASVALLGLGGAVAIGQARSSSSVLSAAPATSSDAADDGSAGEQDAEPERPSTSTTAVRSTTTTESPARSTTTIPPSVPGVAEVDYFDSAVQFESIGPGTAVGFSPDGSAVLVVDDAPGVAAGCEGGELLALYAQDLASGARRPVMGDEARIETGGLELLVDPFGSTPDEVGTRPVYGQEWCDGVPSTVWRGVLAGDGQISMLEELTADDPENPFAVPSAPSGPGEVAISPDGRHMVSATGTSVEVSTTDQVGSDEAGSSSVVGDDDGAPTEVVASLPEDLAVESVTGLRWSPDGQAIAISSADGLMLWNPWTGASQRFGGLPAGGADFDRSGSRLVLEGAGSVIVMTFGDVGSPAAAPPRCSGRVSFRPLTADGLATDGLPAPVIDTVLAIDRAAATCDWAALDQLVPDGFVASLGGVDPIGSWQAEEESGSSPMWYLRTLFRQPHLVETREGTAPTTGARLWPAIDQDDDCRLDEAERASAAALGLDQEVIEEACVVVGGYTGYRTTITDDGVWQSFLAGD